MTSKQWQRRNLKSTNVRGFCSAQFASQCWVLQLLILREMIRTRQSFTITIVYIANGTRCTPTSKVKIWMGLWWNSIITKESILDLPNKYSLKNFWKSSNTIRMNTSKRRSTCWGVGKRLFHIWYLRGKNELSSISGKTLLRMKSSRSIRGRISWQSCYPLMRFMRWSWRWSSSKRWSKVHLGRERVKHRIHCCQPVTKDWRQDRGGRCSGLGERLKHQRHQRLIRLRAVHMIRKTLFLKVDQL